MAILSGKHKYLSIALIISACFACGAFGADAVIQKTQPSTEVFDVKEKDLPVAEVPAPDVPAASNKDIPAPDFKEFEDDAFVNKLLDADKKTDAAAPDASAASATAASATATPPIAPDSPTPAQPVAVAVAPAASALAPTPEGAPAIASPPVAGAEDKKPEQAQQTPASPQEGAVPQAPAQGAEKTIAEAAPAQKLDSLTDAEKASYADLKKHLSDFVASFNGKAPVVVAEEEATKPAAAPEKPVVPVAATPAASEVAASATKPEEVATDAKKPAATDDLDDLLDPDAKVAKAPAPQVAPAAAPAKVASAPTKTEAAKPAAPVATEIKTAIPAKAPEVDIVAELKPAKPKEVYIDEADILQLAEHEAPSEADKAYFKLLDNKREALPASKRISSATADTIDNFSSTLAPLQKRFRKPQHIKIEHGKTSVPGIEEDGVIKSQSKMDISVRTTDKKDEFEKSKVKLERAYKALLVGQVSAAISIYKEVLDKEPANKDAMFGLATAYQKNKQLDQARTIYTDLLKSEPNNQEALNNFLVLVAEEAPEDALIQLEKLERVNSDFSPVPAQIAMINIKLGHHDKAARYLRRAILLSPENLSYKYNLAITYDRLGKEAQALQLYHQLASAASSGAVFSGSIEKLKERMAYLDKKARDKQ